jgi:hypothetical protein
MKRPVRIVGALALGAASAISLLSLQAQTPTSPPQGGGQPQAQGGAGGAPTPPASSVRRRAVSDPLRGCPNRSQQPQVPENELIFYSTSWGNNPQEGQYRREMERLLRLEIGNVKRAVDDVEKKHQELVRLYPEFESYQEIILEDNPGSWRDGIYVNSKKLIVFHYSADKKLECVVLDSVTRSVYNPNLWTRKIMRLYYPNVQTIELHTMRHNFEEGGTLEKTSPEIQLRAMRLVFNNLRTALYSMDMLIAAYYDRRNKRNDWQINL